MITKQRRLMQKILQKAEQDEDGGMSEEEEVLEEEELRKLRECYEAWTRELAGIIEKCRRVGLEVNGLVE